MNLLVAIGRAAILGVVSFATPRFLIGAGIPLDSWAYAMGEEFGVAFTSTTALLLWSAIFFIVYTFIEVRWEPLGRVYQYVGKQAPSSTGNTGSRRLNHTQRKKLADAIINKKIDLQDVKILFSLHGGEEARKFAEELGAVFQQHGWTGHPYVPMNDDHRLTGLKIWYQPGIGKDENAARLSEALEEAGINFGWTPHDPPYSGANLFVYRKP